MYTHTHIYTYTMQDGETEVPREHVLGGTVVEDIGTHLHVHMLCIRSRRVHVRVRERQK